MLLWGPDPEEDREEYEDDETEDSRLTILWTGEMMEMMMTAIHLGMTPGMRMRTRRMRRTRRRRRRLSLGRLYYVHTWLLCCLPTEGTEPVYSTTLMTLRLGLGLHADPRLLYSLSTEARLSLIAVTAALPPPISSISSPVDVRDDIPNAEERRQGIRDVGYGIRDTWVDPAEAVSEIAPMTMGEVNTRVVGLAELHERDTQDLYALLEDAQDGRSRIITGVRDELAAGRLLYGG
ncbi:hypothetical protein Tco_0595774 [Tanacetum coccineum]